MSEIINVSKTSKGLIEQLVIQNNKIKAEINFRGKLTVFAGETGTNKSLIVESIYKLYKENKEQWEQEKLPKLVLFSFKNNSLELTENQMLDKIKKGGNLVLIDNGDTLLKGKEKLLEFINRDTTNQYLIVARRYSLLNISTNNISEIYEGENHSYNKFLSNKKGW